MLGWTPGSTEKDAVHVAIVSIEAAQELKPGTHVELKHGKAFKKDPHEDDFSPIGIVDPFLSAPVQAGHHFYLCLYPDTVTGMRHEWGHPAFDDMNSVKAQLEAIGKQYSTSYDQIIEACEAFVAGENYCFWGDYGPDMMYSHREEIAKLYYQLTGETFDPDQASFRCAC